MVNLDKMIIDKEKVKKILVGLQSIDASSVIDENNNLNIQELNNLPEVVKAKEELRVLGVDMAYLKKHFITASWLIAV